MLEAAHCATHPGAKAHASCSRCGDYACADCWIGDRDACVRCAPSIPGRPDYDKSVVVPISGMGNRVRLRPSIVAGPKLLLDGKPVRRRKRKATLTRPDGTTFEVRVKPRFVDIYPRVWVDDVEYTLMPALPLSLRLWSGVPFVSIVGCGCIGAALAYVMCAFSYQRARADTSMTQKWIEVSAINVAFLIPWILVLLARLGGALEP